MYQIKVGFLAAITASVIASTFAEQIVEIESRIFNGDDAAREQFPYYVFLEILSSVLGIRYGTVCGASLISNQWVITAGHCVSPKNHKIRLHLGSLRKDDGNEVGRKIIDVTGQNVYVHPKYSSFLGILLPMDDIALIKLPSPVEFTDHIKPIPLACSSTVGMNVIAIGNGISSLNGYSSILKYAELKITNQDDSVIYSNGLQWRGVASGDSGGPLVAADTGALVGITSSGTLGMQLFTRVAAYFDWIKDKTGIASCV